MHAYKDRMRIARCPPEGSHLRTATPPWAAVRRLSRHRRSATLCFATVAIAASFDSHSGPWEVGGTGIDKALKLKSEVALKRTHTQDAWVRPGIGIALPATDRVSYEFSVGHGLIETADGTRRSGTRDFDAKLKWQLQEETEDKLAWMFEPKLSLPTGDRGAGIGGERTALELPLRAGRSVGKLYFTGELRYTHIFERGYDRLAGYGGLVEYLPNPRWVVGVDLITDMPLDDHGRYHLRSNLAGKWRPNMHFELQALLGRSIENRRGDPVTSAKLVAEYKF